MLNKEIVFTKSSPLKPEDNLLQTYGCRYHNPVMCKHIGQPKICAFTRSDNLCLNPPNTWKRHFLHLNDKLAFQQKRNDVHQGNQMKNCNS